MSNFDSIRFYIPSEVKDTIKSIVKHPLLKELLNYTFQEKNTDQQIELLDKIESIEDFQKKVIYHTMQRVLKETSEGLFCQGLDNIRENQAYLFISNHRDILLDTSLLNVKLLENNKIMTASAIGDNLVQKPLYLALAKLNRNFIIKRDLSPRELLESSTLVSEYISNLLLKENRSVWIAQREGRTKDGLDKTHPGVLKMIAMASDEENLMDYFKKIKIVPVSISYEYDPTDKLKIPQMVAQINQKEYAKSKNEDFINLMSGVLGQKKRIHLHIGEPLNNELEQIKTQNLNANKQIQELAKVIDSKIISNYKLCPTNYIAYDLLNNSSEFSEKYSSKEKDLFLRRLSIKVQSENQQLLNNFLGMYANPVKQKIILKNEQ